MRLCSNFGYLTEVNSGTGIGLPITKKIIESLEGKIGIESEFGKGNYFFFTLQKDPKQQEIF